MSKLFVAVLAFSIVSLAVGYKGVRLDFFLDNPKIKLLSNPSVQGAYPGDDTDYGVVLNALAALPEPVTVAQVKEVLKTHAPQLANRVEAAVRSFNFVRDRPVGRRNCSSQAKNYLTQFGELVEKYYLVGLHATEGAKEAERLHKLYNVLSDEDKGIVDDKLQDLADSVCYTLNDPYLH